MSDRLSELDRILHSGGSAVFTGNSPTAERTVMMEVFEALGMRVSASVSVKTGCLIIGTDAKQEKVDKAVLLGVPTFTEDEFWAVVLPK